MTARPEQTTMQTITQLAKAAWHATKGARVRFFLFLFCFIIANIIILGSPWAIGYVLEVFVKEGFTDAAFEKAMWGVGAYVGIRLANSVFHHFARYLQNVVAFHARMSMMESLFTSLLRFPLRWHVLHHSGESLSKLNRAVGAIDQSIGTYIWQVVEGVVKIVVAGLAITTLDKYVALNVLGMCLVTILMMVLFNRGLLKNVRRNNAFYDRVNTTVVDFLFNIVTVKTLKIERAGERRIHGLAPEGLEICKRISLFQEFKWGSVGVGYALVIGSSLWIYFNGHRGMAGAFEVTAVYVLLNYLDTIFQAVGSFTGYYSGILEAATAYEDGQKIFDESHAIPPVVSPRKINRDWKKITVENLRFSYPGGEDKSGLKGVTLDIFRGNKIALVGPSGSGKSTLLRLLGGMLVPEHAEVSTDTQEGLAIDDISRISLMLPQEPEIFNETMGYNLTFGEEYTKEQLEFFMSLSKVERVLERLPAGFDSDLAQKGLNLSVGEKQRIALARGLLRTGDKEIILLDEPTSSIDPFTEKQIFFNLLHHFNDRTILTACHRLALVPLFDTIIYVRQGVVEEVGKFQDLVDAGGAFARVWADYQQKITRDTQPNTTTN